MEKLDLTKLYTSYYSAKTTPELVDIEPANFLSLVGKGDPSGPLFSEKLQALYATAYSIKFRCKEFDKDFVVPKLECLWWYDEHRFNHFSMSDAPANIPRSEWEYRLLIRMPEFVTENDVQKGIETVISKKAPTFARDIEFYRMTEGKSIQMLHIGPFSMEPQSLARIAEFSEARGLKRNGVHHEIYLSDFRKTAPEKLKTILREPVK
ncbi:GyrI-like domain-containing protein [Parapedobacter sp. GCM10030251]|uniref:GyrI-like domain-containing protein n=1 Tax=Parapedobacter sp. GCM10030251 TaxID=3273419 RepID=UPI00361C107A